METRQSNGRDLELKHRHGVLSLPDFRRGDTALLVVDIQYGDAHPDHGLLKRMRQQGKADAAAYYVDRVTNVVIPNTRRLLAACRETGIEVIHTGIQSLTPDGRDRSLEHKRLNIHHPPGSVEAGFLPEVAPLPGEIVLYKTCGGVFNGTNIEYVLRNLGVINLIVAGVVTSGCVEVAVRDAADRGFIVTLVEDACASWSPEMESAAIRAMSEIYAKVLSTDDVLSLIASSTAAVAAR